jgi:outer membrane protein insertion porin family
MFVVPYPCGYRRLLVHPARPTPRPPRPAGLGLALALTLAIPGALAQEVAPPPPPPTPPAADEEVDPFEGRPIARVRLERPVPGQPGVTEPLDPVLTQIVSNNLRCREGTEFHADLVIADAKNLNRLERFSRIDHRVQGLDDGSVVVTFILVERPVIQDIQPVGNVRLDDEDILAIASRLVGTAVDDQVIDSVARDIEAAYRKKGYYRVKVEADQEELRETGILYYRIREGERLRVTDIRFTAVDGDLVFTPAELKESKVGLQTSIYIPLFDKGLLDEEVLDEDVTALVTFYEDRGYLDVRVDRAIIEAPNGKEAIVEFIITAGRRYVMRNVIAYYPDRARIFGTRAEAEAAAGPGEHILVLSPSSVAVYRMGLFSSEQIAGLIQIKSGDVYSADKLVQSERAIRDAYGQMGYTDALRPDDQGIVTREAKLDEVDPLVDLVFQIREGPRFKAGAVIIQGNPITRDGVIRGKTEVLPDHPLDSTAVRKTEANLDAMRIFDPRPGAAPRLTLQDEDPANPGYRDVLVEVEDTNTGNFYLNGGVDSDGGATILLGVTQNNFDIANPPDSVGEMFSGTAFRGAGQTFNIELAPGTTYQTYSVSFSDPSLADGDYSMDARVAYRKSDYSQYDEERYGGQLGFGRALGSRWRTGLSFRNEWVSLSDLEPDSPVDFYEVADQNRISGVGISLSRSSTPSFPVSERYVPTRGNRIDMGIEQIGAFGGDFDFTKLRASYIVYLPIYETFYGRTTVLSLSTRVNWIPQDADDVPTYERYYLGGQNFRGFAFRSISPKGIRNDTGELGDTAVGGTWSFFAGPEIRQPVPFAPEFLSVVGFIDTGTVVDSPGFDDYRVSIGAGLRVTIPALSPIPLAFDFGFPILKEDDDEERLFSFSIDVPFR